MKTPCKDCQKRHENCHAECEDYKEWRLILDANKERIADKKIKDAELTRRRNDAIRKRMKRKE